MQQWKFERNQGFSMSHQRPIAMRPVGFSKVFRWTREGPQPVSVAVVGTFNNWQPAPLKFSREHGYWQLTLHDIPGHRTHNYVLLVNGKPVDDPHADGLVVPHTEEEKRFALITPRGPRVLALFSQAK
jgi:1,4-alpha-glucan branching enzyme